MSRMVLVVDSETTGVEADSAVVEVGAVPLHEEDGRWKMGAGAQSLVDPLCPIPAQASAVHNITDDDVRGERLLGSAVDYVTEKCRGHMPHLVHPTVVAAHNADFDRRYLGDDLAAVLSLPEWVCTWRCARHLYQDAPGHSNQVLRYHLGLNDLVRAALATQPQANARAHRALYDATVTGVLLMHMLRELTLDQLVVLTSAPVILRNCNFGAKHRGTPWSQVPMDYMRWMQREVRDMDEDTRYTIEFYLNGGRPA